MQVNFFLKNAIISTVLLFLFVTGVSAEPYISKEFPPNEVLVKAIGLGNVKVLGKTTGQDNQFTVYYQQGNSGINGFSLFRLDTNMWIYIIMSLDPTPRILQK